MALGDGVCIAEGLGLGDRVGRALGYSIGGTVSTLLGDANSETSPQGPINDVAEYRPCLIPTHRVFPNKQLYLR